MTGEIKWGSEKRVVDTTGIHEARVVSSSVNLSRSAELPINIVSTQHRNRQINLWAQSDSHQCGPCAIHNLCQILGFNLDLTAIQMRGLRIGQPEHQGHNLRTYDFFSTDIYSILNTLPNSNGRVAYIRSTDSVMLDGLQLNNSRDINTIKGMILNLNGNHWVAFFKDNQSWFKIDSLRSSNLEPVEVSTFEGIEQVAHGLGWYGVAITEPDQSSITWNS